MNKFDPFLHEHLFYEYKVKITTDEINQVLILIKNEKTKDKKSTFDSFNILNFPILKNLKKQIIDILEKHNLTLKNNWAQFYNSNNKHIVHCHYGSVYSGIIYLDGLEPSPTVFYDSLFNNVYQHKFKKNTLLMFPSMTPHEVRSLKKDEQRLIISFNTTKEN